MRGFFADVRKADLLQQRLHVRVVVDAQRKTFQLDVLERRQFGEKSGRFDERANHLLALKKLVARLAHKGERARGGRRQAANHFEDGRLTRAVSADKPVYLPFLDVNIDLIRRPMGTVDFRQVFRR